MQMLAGGAFLLPLSLSVGELGRLDATSVSPRSILALLYLVVFGALFAFSAYIWLLTVSTPARVGTYAYVNPVVALILGWALAGEPLTFRSMVAAVIIVGSVVIITGDGLARRRSLAEPPQGIAQALEGVTPPQKPRVP